VVNRISRVDANTNRIQETGDRGGRGRRDQEEEEKKKEKDKFDKSKPFWKRLLGDSEARTGRTPRASLAMGKKPKWKIETDEETPAPPEDELSDTGSFTEETSLSVSQRFLVVAGILDMTGRPRLAVVLTYVVIAGVIAVSTLLIFGIVFK